MDLGYLIFSGLLIEQLFLGSYSQSIKFHNVSENSHLCQVFSDRSRIVAGEVYLPESSEWQNYIFFDIRLENSQTKPVCFIEVTSKCQNGSITDKCYCTPTNTENVYHFVVNMTMERNYGDVIGFLLFKNSSRLIAETPFPLETGLNKNMDTEMVINEKKVGDSCREMVYDRMLNIKAKCQNFDCWLELSIKEISLTLRKAGRISHEYLNPKEKGGKLTLSLSRSLCGDKQFQQIYTCEIEFGHAERESEEDMNDEIIIICIAVLVIITIVVVTLFLIKRNRWKNPDRHTYSSQTNIEEPSPEKDSGIEGASNPIDSTLSQCHHDNEINEERSTLLKSSVQNSTAEEEEPPSKPPRLYSLPLSSSTESRPVQQAAEHFIFPEYHNSENYPEEDNNLGENYENVFEVDENEPDVQSLPTAEETPVSKPIKGPPHIDKNIRRKFNYVMIQLNSPASLKSPSPTEKS